METIIDVVKANWYKRSSRKNRRFGVVAVKPNTSFPWWDIDMCFDHNVSREVGDLDKKWTLSDDYD